MYDISQLNDMLVPELKDIADQLSIPHANKPDKQDLIYKILDRQASGDGSAQPAVAERPKRKRIAKVTAAPPKQEDEVSTDTKPEVEEPSQKENFKGLNQRRGRRPKAQK